MFLPDLLSSIFSWICIKHTVGFYQILIHNMNFETEYFIVLFEDGLISESFQLVPESEKVHNSDLATFI